MTKRNTLLTLILIVIAHGSIAQITQLELASGLKKTDFTSFSLRPLTPTANFSIGTLAFFQKYHEQESFMFDEAGVHSTIYWNINKAFSIGPGLYYNSAAGFSQRLSILYAIKSQHLVLTAIPTIAHAEQTGFINGEMFLQMQLTIPLKEEWELLLSAQVLTNWEKFSLHTRSFQQLRAGFDKHATQFGLALDYDQYGDAPITRTSLGVFVRKIFLTNK
ncbi:hypothetical protein [Fulvivirga lutimaris]|uniref:hypothetical protein n=1 Tax=Fulvivirga lutimaris TaxID=1819566 RepID=UPI0012BC8D66|nr:hypothetical protein [Fulvivirga lutimaris]MTI39708.1 hypothetical protein [Fulvivirga lutimaris]